MKSIIDTMKEYLKMDSEIEYREFCRYYKEIMDFLQKDYQSMTEEDLVNMCAVLQIVAANALDRSNKKEENFKKFKKMAEKSQFWFTAIEARMHKEFKMAKPDFDKAVDAVFED